MGAVCAIVYILTVIVFIPFPFYKDIVAATSGGGNRDVMLERQELETGRTLHLFPHSKVSCSGELAGPVKKKGMPILIGEIAGVLPVGHLIFTIGCSTWHRR